MRVLFYCVFLSLAIGNAVFATQNSIVEFFAIGKPSFLKIHGESAGASQNLKIQDDIKTKEKKAVAERPREASRQTEQIKTVAEHTPVIKTPHKTATDILSQDFNLLD